MKKIHEQEWKYRGLSGDVIGPGGLSLTCDGAPDDALRLISAAPEMARALLAVREACVARTDEESKALKQAFDALRSAGVL